MAAQHYINLSVDELAIVDSVQNNGKVGRCKICKQQFKDVVAIVTHLLTDHDRKGKTFDLATVVKLCRHLDPKGSQGFLESYEKVYGIGPALCLRPRVVKNVLTCTQVDPGKQCAVRGGSASAEDTSPSEEDTSITDDEVSAMDTSEDGSVELDDLDRDLLGDDDDYEDDEGLQHGSSTAPTVPDALDRDFLGDKDEAEEGEEEGEESSQDSENTRPAGSEFSATPPPWLSMKDRIEWRFRHDRESTKTTISS